MDVKKGDAPSSTTKSGVLMAAFLLLGIAAAVSACGEWYPIGCYGTYNMGDSGGMDLIPCAISQSTGGGGSKIITHNNYYCTHFTEWQSGGYFRLHAVLYKGANCQDWNPRDYCYNEMYTGGDCNRYVDWGETINLGGWANPQGSVQLDYRTSQWGPLMFGHSSNPLLDWMNFKIGVSPEAPPGNGGGSKAR